MERGTDINMIYYALDKNGKPIGKVGQLNDVEIQTEEPELTDEIPMISLTDSFSGEFKIELMRKDKRTWGRILQMPKYKVTEWMFPRKKKRGTMKRKRRLRKEMAQAIINLIRNMDFRNVFRDIGVTAEQAGKTIQKFEEMLRETEDGTRDTTKTLPIQSARGKNTVFDGGGRSVLQ